MLYRDLEVFFIDSFNRPRWIGAAASIGEAMMIIRNEANHTPGKYMLRSHHLNAKAYLDANQSGEVVPRPTATN